MSETIAPIDISGKRVSGRFASIDFARGIAIVAMLFLHMVGDTLDIDGLLNTINDQALINILALILLPFYGGLAGFFLLISAAGNMVSMQRDLGRGKTVRSIVLKQVFGGILLLIFAMLSEGLMGYHGTIGEFFFHMNNPNQPYLNNFLFRWNVFETVHTIAWCLIINGIIQGILSLNGKWKDTKRQIIAYVILAFVVIGLTQPIWDLVGLIGPGYPWGRYPNGHEFYLPWIGSEPFWHIFRAPFLTALAAPMEPIFPYLAVSFMGSIFGIIISQPKEKISKKFTRNSFLIGGSIFLTGLVGLVFIMINIISAPYPPGVDGFLDIATQFYRFISFHRHWAPDNASYMLPGQVVPIPPFSWLAQFLVLNGFGLLAFTLLFRLVEFRGRSKVFSDKTRYVRRFGTVAFSIYNNQFLYFIVFAFTSWVIKRTAYTKLPWWGTFLTIGITFLLFHFILLGWEKIKYTGSLEWLIRSTANSLVPARKDAFDESVKWWQKGKVDVDKTFYNADWIDLDEKDKDESKANKIESKFSFRLAIISLCSILFIAVNIISLFVSIRARKLDGKNKHNTAGLVISIIGNVLILTVIIVTLAIKVGALGLF